MSDTPREGQQLAPGATIPPMPEGVPATPKPQGDAPEEKTFEGELRSLLNRYSAENVSGTPDFVLSGYLVGAIKLYNDAVSRRAAWRGELVDFQPWTHGQNGGSDGNIV